MIKYEHAPEAVDAMAKRLHALSDFTLEQSRAFRAARMVLDRERILRDGLMRAEVALINGAPDNALHHIVNAFRDLAAYDAPKVPTLLEAVSEAEALPGQSVSVDGTVCVLVPRAQWNAVMIAAEREEGGAK